jgi:hypothetical protein
MPLDSSDLAAAFTVHDALGNERGIRGKRVNWSMKGTCRGHAMKNRTILALQVLLWFVCLSHIVLGVAIMTSPEFQQKVATIYGARVDWTPQFVYILRPLGAFMTVLGLIGLTAAVNPLRNRVIVYGFAVLLAIRVVQRFVFKDDIEQAFDIEPNRNMIAAGGFLVIAVLLVLLLQIAQRSSGQAAR